MASLQTAPGAPDTGVQQIQVVGSKAQLNHVFVHQGKA